MDTTLAILMVIGIFVGIPLVIGFAIVGTFVLSGRRAQRAKRAEASAPSMVQEFTPRTIKIDSRE